MLLRILLTDGWERWRPSLFLPPLTGAGGGTKDRGSWLVEPFLPKLCGLWTQAAASCRLIAGEKGTWLSSSREGQRPGFTFSCSELLPWPRPPRRGETLQCEATKAAPTTATHSCSVSYNSSALFSVLGEQKTRNWNSYVLKRKIFSQRLNWNLSGNNRSMM